MRNNTQQSLGPFVWAAMEQAGIGPSSLARRLGVARNTIYNWKNGATPDLEILPRIAEELSVGLDELLRLRRDGNGFEPYAREQLETIIARIDEMTAMMQRAWVAELTADVVEIEALRSAPDAPPLPKVLERRVRSLTRRVETLERLSA